MQLGIDIGGNHVGMGLVDEDGKILEKKVYDYKNELVSADEIFSVVNYFISSHNKIKFDGIGIGIPGIATDTQIKYTCNLPLKDVEIRDYIKTNLPIFVSNDANCAAIAEYEIVDKKFYSNYAFVTVGTGIGAGIILNGQLYTGTSGSAGELGHTIIEKDGLPCKCGRRGCFERYASVTALKRMTGLESLKEIFYLSEVNETVQRVLDEYVNNLADGLANFMNLYDFEMMVMGGSLVDYSDAFMHKLKTKIISKMYNKYTTELNIKAATLGNDAGIIGASLLHKYE